MLSKLLIYEKILFSSALNKSYFSNPYEFMSKLFFIIHMGVMGHGKLHYKTNNDVIYIILTPFAVREKRIIRN